MLDRTVAPEIKEVEEVKFIYPKFEKVTENVPFFWIKDVPNATARLDFYFDAGTIRSKSLIASITAGMLFSGSNVKDSTTFHNLLDDAGAYHDISVTHEQAVVSFYGLNEQMIHIFRIFEEAMDTVVFPQSEFEEIINERKQKLQVSLEKVGVLAQRAFQKSLFDQTDYGRFANLEDFDTLLQSEIVDFFEKFYKKGLVKIVLVGDIPHNDVNDILNQSKKWAISHVPTFKSDFVNQPSRIHLEKKDAIQTAVRIGKLLFNKEHEDYISFTILNTILGDYFGSRLMKNIREDKGYTYGIGSFVSELNHTGYFIIATEVGSEFADKTIEEIRKEIEILQTDLIDEQELDLVRSYLLGQILKTADGPYATMDLYLGVQNHGMDLEFYNRFIHKIRMIQPMELREIARKYLVWDTLNVISVG
ncbi:MAG: M16 family metallopeptidase [Bacteroidota bacterium]